MRQQVRRLAWLWLAWTAAGLFYITQDSVPRLYRGEPVAWKYVFVGWMAGMYVCAALTPAVLWLGDRWPVERRIIHTAWHLGFSGFLTLSCDRCPDVLIVDDEERFPYGGAMAAPTSNFI